MGYVTAYTYENPSECVADSFSRPLFQITSGTSPRVLTRDISDMLLGDLGTSAKEVEAALEENFTLASRWGCILLIDEADVFLAERGKGDLKRNSLVAGMSIVIPDYSSPMSNQAVFLRIMEYYSGVLFLTTNRVGVFDEAFTSRMHISLYYPPLERASTRQIFEKNMERIKSRYERNQRQIDIKVSEITEFALEYYDDNKEGRWNGRQIRNAFQSALALAELKALGDDEELDKLGWHRLVTLDRSNFEVVAAAYKGFIDYLNQTYGADFARRARENLWRYDTFGLPKVPNALTNKLKVMDPRHGPEPWGSQHYTGHGFNRGPHPMYPPQGGYHDRHAHQSQETRFAPSSGHVPLHDTREIVPNPAMYAAHHATAPASLPPEGHGHGIYPDRRDASQPGMQPYAAPQASQQTYDDRSQFHSFKAEER
jgi:SpoVK/Ycf46/Vps4 family AAA+-type ATPase